MDWRATLDLDDESLDLALAAELQSALLPKRCPTDCPHHVAAARNRMCGSVGGDFYDFIRINEDQIAVFIGDVVGHGVRASLLMAQIMGHINSRKEILPRPRDVMTSLNRLLLDLGERIGSPLSCSFFYAVIDSPTGASFFFNAGHPRPLLCDGGQCHELVSEPQNILLGVEEFDPIEGCHTFQANQRLVLYTDGLVEASGPQGNRFGLGRLRELLAALVNDTADRCAEAVFQAVHEFRRNGKQTDDETIVIIDRV